MRVFIIFLVLVFSLQSWTKAEEGLKNLKEFDLIIEKTNSCGITNTNIEREIRYLLSNSPVAIKEDISIEAMYVRPTILEFKDFRCSGYAAFEIWGGGYMKNSAGVEYFGKQLIYNKGFIYSSAYEDFRKNFLDQVIGTLVKDFIVAWKSVN